ncbi:hypothetical protein G6011_520 [Alternaria panax]|uniref:Uncharacterized protein n=1 Tax=Alternaria panax TaxID=48097 RepID=A0AAD4NV48_9PLEO|nr:hypothetical protein G6011_520 [Alternaria panax]
MRIPNILVTLVTVLPTVISTSIPSTEDLRKNEPSQETLPTEICDNIGEERCLGNEWRLKCSIEHRWKAFEECPEHGRCGALKNKTFCLTDSSPPMPPSPPSHPQPETCLRVGDHRCAKWSNGIHRIDVCYYDLFWASVDTCSPEEFCMYWVPGKELSLGEAKCTFISDVPPTGPLLKTLGSRSSISQGTLDALEYCIVVGETRCSEK